MKSNIEELKLYFQISEFLTKETKEELIDALKLDRISLDKRILGRKGELEFINILKSLNKYKNIFSIEESTSAFLESPATDIIAVSNNSIDIIEIKTTTLEDKKKIISIKNYNKICNIANNFNAQLFFAIKINNNWGLFKGEYLKNKNFKINKKDLEHSIEDFSFFDKKNYKTYINRNIQNKKTKLFSILNSLLKDNDELLKKIFKELKIEVSSLKLQRKILNFKLFFVMKNKFYENFSQMMEIKNIYNSLDFSSNDDDYLLLTDKNGIKNFIKFKIIEDEIVLNLKEIEEDTILAHQLNHQLEYVIIKDIFLMESFTRDELIQNPIININTLLKKFSSREKKFFFVNGNFTRKSIYSKSKKEGISFRGCGSLIEEILLYNNQKFDMNEYEMLFFEPIFDKIQIQEKNTLNEDLTEIIEKQTAPILLSIEDFYFSIMKHTGNNDFSPQDLDYYFRKKANKDFIAEIPIEIIYNFLNYLSQKNIIFPIK